MFLRISIVLTGLVIISGCTSPENKSPSKPSVEKIFNGKNINNWSMAGSQQERQNWRIESGQLASCPKILFLESYLIWKGTLPESYKVSVKFNVERIYIFNSNHVGLVYALNGSSYESIQVNSNDSGANGTMVFIKQNDKCKSLLNGKILNENIMLSGSPVIGLMTKNSRVYFSNITLEELK